MDGNFDWRRIISILDYAFQPIVNIHTGICFGYEALLRKHEEAGFKSIQEVFDAAYGERALASLDFALRRKAIEKFCLLNHASSARLFFNLDNRILEMPDYNPGDTAQLLAEFNLPSGVLAFEISERHEVASFLKKRATLLAFKEQGIRVAIDDFGTGFSGLQLLYCAEPEFIKIDRFFINDIASDTKKKLFVSHIVNICHMLGILVIAEGVEKEVEFFCCKEVGCDFVQGYMVQRPTLKLEELKMKYEHIETISRHDRRKDASDCDIVHAKIDNIPPLRVDMDMTAVVETFRKYRQNTFFPVLNSLDEPLGLVREESLKSFVYSQYGKDVLQNRAMRNQLAHFLSKCPIVDINTGTERILEILSLNDDCEGILIVKDLKYAGFLSARSLLKVIHEKRLAVARDQNPLTRLPGNYLIHEQLSQALSDTNSFFIFVYYDFDNFKPFNDKYGFRNGDRAILIFAELLKKEVLRENRFIGHVGGDDFFVSYKNTSLRSAYEQTGELVRKFTLEVESLYYPADREKGFIQARDREGNIRRFPLMTISAAILGLSRVQKPLSVDEVYATIAELKKTAKMAENHIAVNPELSRKDESWLSFELEEAEKRLAMP